MISSDPIDPAPMVHPRAPGSVLASVNRAFTGSHSRKGVSYWRAPRGRNAPETDIVPVRGAEGQAAILLAPRSSPPPLASPARSGRAARLPVKPPGRVAASTPPPAPPDNRP